MTKGIAEKQLLIRDFTKGSVNKQMLEFATPLALSNLMQILYNIADMVIVGYKMSDVGISAVSVGGDITHFLTFIAIGLAGANQVIISQYIGAGQKEKLGRFIGTMLIALFGCAVILSTVCFFLRNQLLLFMNTPLGAWEQTLSYVSVSIAGLVFIYGYNICSSIMRGLGDSIHPFLFISIAAVLNVLLDLLFVLVFDMKAGGAALATVLSQGLSFFIAARFLFHQRSGIGFSLLRADLRLDKGMLKKLLGLGIPMAIKSASIQFSKLFVNSFINSYGLEISAVAGIGNKLSSIVSLVSLALNNAGSAMIAQNIGARKYGRVSRIILSGVLICLCVAGVVALALVLFPAQIFAMFKGSAEVVKLAMIYMLPIIMLNYLSSVLRGPFSALINGSGNYRANFAVAILDGIVMRIGLALLLGRMLHMEFFGFWLGDALASFTPFFIGSAYYLSGKWKTRKYIIGE